MWNKIIYYCLGLAVLLQLSLARADVIWLHAPDGRGRPFDLVRLRGQVVVLTFASRYTRGEAARVNGALGDRAQTGRVAMVSVVDFVGIPGLFHGYARGKVAESDRPDRVKLLVDEESQLRRGLPVQPDRRLDILVLDRDGTLRGHFIGEGQLGDALRLVERVSAQPPPVSSPAFAAAGP